MYEVRTREIGELIEVCNSYEEARECLAQIEEMDMNDGIYVPDFYEIVEC